MSIITRLTSCNGALIFKHSPTFPPTLQKDCRLIFQLKQCVCPKEEKEIFSFLEELAFLIELSQRSEERTLLFCALRHFVIRPLLENALENAEKTEKLNEVSSLLFVLLKEALFPEQDVERFLEEYDRYQNEQKRKAPIFLLAQFPNDLKEIQERLKKEEQKKEIFEVRLSQNWSPV